MMWFRLDELAESIRVEDFLDIAIVASLLYLAFVWLRDRASRSLGIVVCALGVIFLLARWLDLYLTTMAFHYGSVGILIAMVVVFQHDIRHGFERLASSHWFRRSHADLPCGKILDTITEAVANMAEHRIGSLIIFPGREPLERHVRGGIDVDGKISQQLLLSIFHPKSPGHDGAVLITQNRIAQLGLHLPLSTQLSQVHDGGTRHAAALGLAECSDAIALVVSEERGTISLARDSTLTEIEPADVAEQLRSHFCEQSGDDCQNRESRRTDWLTKFAAVLSAVALWLLFAYHTDTIQRTLVVPIEYRNLPSTLEIDDPKPTHAEVTLSGSEPAFAVLNPSELAVSLEVKDVDGRRVLSWQTEPNVVNVPKELHVQNMSPETIIITLREKPSSQEVAQ
ncbi:diadenylate cyclase [Rhodopirellula sp. SWK7]|uniref:diadenylate cyclase n=1 Tax=Rhodopirellula sp. SWK7 TaxID=595460 RepID=UPI0002BDB0F7|nr:diadenylate cyclase [Rhodopirellula sp. SWK7]EMI42431.1 membrane protein containing DNA integrity scanning protein, DisA [Rhodopirellula sp. SWK7]